MSRTATATSRPHTCQSLAGRFCHWCGAAGAARFVLGATAGQGWIRILNFALLYVMLALGLNIVVGFAGLLDLGYIAFYAVGPIRGRCWLRRILICTCRFGWYCPLGLPWPLWRG